MIRAIIAICLFATTIAQTNSAVDATLETRDLTRKIIGGTSGGTGQSLPVDLQTVIVNGGKKAGDKLFVDFIITNSGRQSIVLPVSPNARDIEPEGSSPSTFKRLSLFLTVEHGREPLMLKGGASLYGTSALEGTLRTLRPSESLIVHTVFLLASWEGPLSGTQTLTGHVRLLNETLKPKGSNLESVSSEIGSATANPLSWTIATGYDRKLTGQPDCYPYSVQTLETP